MRSFFMILPAVMFGVLLFPDRCDANDSSSDPAVSVLETFAGKATFEIPALSEKNHRQTVDVSNKYDLGGIDSFRLTLKIDNPKVSRRITLFFHSGDGWYVQHASLPGSSTDWQTITYPKSGFRTEGTPGSWSKVDAIRIAIPRLANIKGKAELAPLLGTRAPVLMLASESSAGKSYAKALGDRFRKMKLRFGTVPEKTLTPEMLQGRAVVVLPYSPELDPKAVALLKAFLDRGGKLIACFELPAVLMKELGVESGKAFKSPDGQAKFAEVRFENDDFDVSRFAQQSWIVRSAFPAKDAAVPATVAAWWYDAAGKKTPHPALLIGQKGAFFTHVLLPDDTDTNKNPFLKALLAYYDPGYWRHAVEEEYQAIFAIGGFVSLSPARRGEIRQAVIARVGADPETLLKASGTSPKQFRELFDKLSEARKAMTLEYCKSFSSKKVEGRGWWEHGGVGAYPGNWDKSIKMLADNGFNMVIPNMLWGGAAHYKSDVLERSKTYERYGDQIEQCLAACKKYGVELHVWKVCFRLDHASAEYVKRMEDEGRVQYSAKGEKSIWLCPSHPKNVQLESDAMCEVVRNYDVDGVHFDYIRYSGGEYCFCDGCRERFEKESGKKVANWPADAFSGERKPEYEQWRRDRITNIVAKVSQDVKKIKPAIKVSAAIQSDTQSRFHRNFQDWPVWIDRGYLDFMCCMTYTDNNAHFAEILAPQMPLLKRRIPIYPGIGAASSRSRLTPDEVATQIDIARKLGADGFTIFAMTRATIELLPEPLHAGPTSEKAVPPHSKP